MLSISKLQNVFYLFRVKLLESLSIAFDFLFIKIYLGILLILNLSVWALAILFKKQLTQNLIILHFNVDSGVDLIGASSQILLMPAIATLVSIINIFLIFVFWNNDNFHPTGTGKFLAHILLAASLLVNVFILMSFGPLYYINFR